MSLGITLPWRARSHRTGVSGISLIPRGPRRWSRAPSAQLPLFRQWIHVAPEAATPNPVEATCSFNGTTSDEAFERTSHDAAVRTAGGCSPAEAASLPSARRTNKDAEDNGADRALGTRTSDIKASTPTETIPTGRVPSCLDGPRVVKPIRKTTPTLKWNSNPRPMNALSQLKKEEKVFTLKKLQDSVLIPGPFQYKAPRETTMSFQRSHQGLARQLRLDTIREIKQEPLTDWRSVLEILRLQTRHLKGPWQTRSCKLSISAGLGDVLLYDADNTIWDIHEKTRCHIDLRWSHEGDDATTSDVLVLLLSGDEAALESAVEEVNRLAARVGSGPSIGGVVDSRVSDSDAPKEKPAQWEKRWLSSNELHRPSHMSPYPLYRKYEEIPKPKLWTVQTLEAYVAAITSANLPPRYAYLFYGSGGAADSAALALLHAAFQEAAACQALSLRSLKLALRYIESRGHSYRYHARELFCNMTKYLHMDAAVFNLLLEGNVKVKDLHNFDVILKQMIRYGCQPNTLTWTLFLRMMEHQGVRRHIVKDMHQCGLFVEPTTVQLVANELVVWDVREQKDYWPGIREFCGSQVAKYGRNWASRKSMNKIMTELARMGDFASCLELFDLMAQSNSISPTSVTLDTILIHARAQRDLNTAMAALEKASQRKIALTERSYNELFALLFRLRKPNMMGLVWRFACLEGKTSWPMRNRVSQLTSFGGQASSKEGDTTYHEVGIELPAVPTFYHSDMLADIQQIRHRRRGAVIAWGLHERYQGWTPQSALHTLLKSAWEEDNAIHRAVKEAKEAKRRQQEEGEQQQQQHSKATPSEADVPTTVSTCTAPTRTVPGVSIVLRRKEWESEAERIELRELDMTVTHIVTPEKADGETGSQGEDPPWHAAGDEKKMPGVERQFLEEEKTMGSKVE